MKLIQLNVWGGRIEYTLNEFLRREQPDILCLQEAIDLERGRGALFSSVSEMAALIGAEYHYMSPTFSFNYMHRKAHFGNCIISKLPIQRQETFFTGKEYVADFDWTKHRQDIRNLQYAQILLPGNIPLNLLNHHGHHNYTHKDGDDETIRQCNMIADKIRPLHGKTILTGDFNLVPNSESLQPINKLLRNLTLEAELSTTRTVLTHKTEACDYIFVSPEVTVVSFIASDIIVSDHQALILEFN